MQRQPLRHFALTEWLKLVLLPPLAAAPVAVVLAIAMHLSRPSLTLVALDATLIFMVAAPVALLVQATYGIACIILLRRLALQRCWTYLVAGVAPIALLHAAGAFSDALAAGIAAGFGAAIAITSWFVVRTVGHDTPSQLAHSDA